MPFVVHKISTLLKSVYCFKGTMYCHLFLQTKHTENCVFCIFYLLKCKHLGNIHKHSAVR